MQHPHPNGGSVYLYTGGRPWPPGSDVDGTPAAASATGAGPRPGVVFLHGALNDHSVWTLPARWFAHHGWTALAPDLPGHGRSTGPALPDIGALADWLLALLQSLGIAQVALVGHSMGSLIALEAAARASMRAGQAGTPRVTHLVLVGTAVPMPVSDALLATAAQDPMRAIDLVVSYAHSSLGAKPGNPGPGTWHHGASRQLMRQVLARSIASGAAQPNLFHHDFSLCNAYAGGMDAALRVAEAGSVRSSLIVGERDRMTLPRAALAVGEALAARRYSLAKAGHELMQEDPEGVLRALRAALG